MKRLLGQTVNYVGSWGLAQGALAGGLLAAPLIGLMYLLDQLAKLPFAPFAFFDWIARVLPGPLVTFGIDLMIDGLRLVGMSVAAAAKTAEQIPPYSSPSLSCEALLLNPLPDWSWERCLGCRWLWSAFPWVSQR